MKSEKLDLLITELNDELKKLDKNDSNKQLIEHIQSDLQMLKQRQNDISSQQEENDNVFLKAAVHFEETHPRLSSSLNDIAHLLSNMGI